MDEGSRGRGAPSHRAGGGWYEDRQRVGRNYNKEKRFLSGALLTVYVSMLGSPSPTLCLVSLAVFPADKVMGSSLIMHKEPNKQGDFRNSERGGGAGSQASAGGPGEQEIKEVRASFVSLISETRQHPSSVRCRMENLFER